MSAAHRHVEHVMGTAVSFDVRAGDVSRDKVRTSIERACGVLHDVDAKFSTWKPESPLSRLRRGELELTDAPEEFYDVFGLCARARELTGGWFDAWAMPGGVDPTGLVKGWGAQLALEELKRGGIAAAMVNAGGDIAVFGRPEPDRAWQCAIRDPARPDAVICIAEVDAAIATSGSYERGDHIYDPRRRTPASAFSSATVIGPDLTMADAFATAIIAGGSDAAKHVRALDGYELCTVEHDGTIRATTAFPMLGTVAR